MTLKEIAAMAGVSVSTVSRVLNCPENTFASEPVRERIWQIVRETGYVPNAVARSLKIGSQNGGLVLSHTIMCFLGRSQAPSDNPFFVQVVRSVEQHALQMGYTVSCTYSNFDIHDYHSFSNITNISADGAIVVGRFGRDTRRFFEEHYKNSVVYTGLNSIDTGWDQVICDGYQIAKDVMNHLINLGHRKIAYIGEVNNEIRYVGYKDALALAGMEWNKSYVQSFTQNGSGGYGGAKKLIEDNTELPSAVFCANDSMAVATIRCFLEHGLNVPGDISVISVDNIELAQYVSPMLTTIDVPKEELGHQAVRMLIDRVNKGHHLPMKLVLPHKLIVRESVAAYH